MNGYIKSQLDRYVEDFEQIRQQVGDETVAAVILHEMMKDRRMQVIREERQADGGAGTRSLRNTDLQTDTNEHSGLRIPSELTVVLDHCWYSSSGILANYGVVQMIGSTITGFLDNRGLLTLSDINTVTSGVGFGVNATTGVMRLEAAPTSHLSAAKLDASGGGAGESCKHTGYSVVNSLDESV